MKYDCDLIGDLLPLYKDGACSQSSTKAVEEHLAECPKCTRIYEELKDTVIDELIVREKESVIDAQSKFFKRKSAMAGLVVAALFALPILICLIVNLASGHGLTWFFIVFAAMLIPSSLFVVPLMAPANKMFLTMTSFTASLIILLAVCCIYSKGNWFFVAASAVLFGLTVCFSPFIVCRRPVKDYLKNSKGLAAMSADTFTYFLMMLCIGLHTRSLNFFKIALPISIPLILMVWVVFFIIRYLPFNGMVKAGICITFLSAFSYFGTKAIVYLTYMSIGQKVDVQVHSTYSIISIITGVVLGLIFIGIGIARGKKEEKTND